MKGLLPLPTEYPKPKHQIPLKTQSLWKARGPVPATVVVTNQTKRLDGRFDGRLGGPNYQEQRPVLLSCWPCAEGTGTHLLFFHFPIGSTTGNVANKHY